MSFSYLTRWLSTKFRRELAQLKDLKPLPKVHWSWSLPDFALNQPDERVYEVVRVMGSACLQGEYATPQHVATCVKLCHPVGGRIGINLKPYHNTVPDSSSPLIEYPDELSLLHKALVNVRTWLSEANAEYDHGGDVAVGAILLDSERFYRAENVAGADAWNAAIRAKYDTVYDLCKSIFPSTRVIWYEWGVEAAPSKTGWQLAPWYVPEAKTDALSCDLYSPCELHRMRETFTKTVEEANWRSISFVVPYLSLASGYQRGQKEFQTWNSDWKYGKEYAYQLGQEINVPWFSWPEQVQRFAPWHRADAAVFYPPPFDPRVPSWLDYFVAYCYGAEERKALL
jgi:hypothetical protein